MKKLKNLFSGKKNFLTKYVIGVVLLIVIIFALSYMF